MSDSGKCERCVNLQKKIGELEEEIDGMAGEITDLEIQVDYLEADLEESC